MQKFIISVKEKQTGRDVIAPYIINSLLGLGSYSERISPLGLVVIVDSIKKRTILSNLLKTIKMATKNNIWKIVIGAVSAALGYVLNAIGL